MLDKFVASHLKNASGTSYKINKTSYNMTDTASPKVQSEVPGEQQIRIPTEDSCSQPNERNETFDEHDKNINGYSPRLQKMRKVHKTGSSAPEEVDGAADLKIRDEGHPTKIPGLRVKQAVERFKGKKEDRKAVDKNSPYRRSSIPKLVPRGKNVSLTGGQKNGTYKVTRRPKRPNLEETFEQIYSQTSIDEKVLDEKLNEIITDVEDADKKFEMVANSYEIDPSEVAEEEVAEEITPLDDKKASKIPIKRFISQHEKGKIKGNVDRRHSVHTNVDNNNVKKLSKKKINNIDNLDELLDAKINIHVNENKETLQTKIKHNEEKDYLPKDTDSIIILNPTPKDESTEDLTVTPVTKKNEPYKLDLKEYTPGQHVNIETSKTLLKKQHSLSDLDSEDKLEKKDFKNEVILERKDLKKENKLDTKDFKDFYVTELDEVVNVLATKVTQDVPPLKDDNKRLSRHDSLFEIENSEIRPVLTKIAMFEKQTHSSSIKKDTNTTDSEKIHANNMDIKLSKDDITYKNNKTKDIFGTLNEDSNNSEIFESINPNVDRIAVKIKSKHETEYIKSKSSQKNEFKTKKEGNEKSEIFESINPNVDTLGDKIKSKNETAYRKSKSSPDLETSNAIGCGYKKQQKYSRLSSVEKLVQKIERNSKMCVIDAREMPRRKSVSEKIALFEGKLAQTNNDPISNKMVESIKLKLLNNATSEPSPTLSVNVFENNDSIDIKIEELKKAKFKFGTMEDVPTIKLNNGFQMPVIALGTALLDPELTYHIVAAAIDLGYRAIDTAYIYGNEREIGEAIKHKIEDGTVKREELFIINKLWSTFHQTDLVEGACRLSLDAMQLDYFDLYLVHNPMSFKEGPNPIPKIANVLQYSSYNYIDAWYGMEALVPKGLVRSIGVSNFNSVQLARILDKGKIAPVVNQVESHPYLSQVRLQEFCSGYNVLLQCYGVLGSSAGAAGVAGGAGGAGGAVRGDSLVRVCAAAMRTTPAQALIRFQLTLDRAVVVQASSATHLRENLTATTARGNEADLRSLLALNRNKRMFNFKGLGDTHRHFPFNIPF